MGTVRTYLGLIVLVAAPAMAGDSAYRVFMAADGQQRDQPTSGETIVSIAADSATRVMVWMESINPADELEAHQIIIPFEATPIGGACGTVRYVDINPGVGGGNTIFIDVDRPDWLFAKSLSDTAPVYTEQRTSGYFGVFYATIIGAGITPPAGIRYLCEYELAASPDACGVFALPFRRPPEPPPQTAIFGSIGSKFIVDEFQTLLIDAGPCDTPCGAPVPLFSIPPDGAIDPGGVAGPDGVGGTDVITVVFTAPVSAGMDDFDIVASGGTTPEIVGLGGDATAVDVLLDRPIPGGACTTLTYAPTGWTTQLRSLPGDVNGDGLTSPIDILALIDHLNGITRPPLADWQCDIDGSGVCNGLDILQLIDLLNGAIGDMPWNGVRAPTCP